MWDFFGSSIAQAVYWLAALLILSLAGWSYVTNWRDENVSESSSSDVLANMRDLRRQGLLDDDEFRTIKTSIGDRPRDNS